MVDVEANKQEKDVGCAGTACERSLLTIGIGIILVGCALSFVYICFDFSKLEVDTRISLKGRCPQMIPVLY